MEIDVTKVDPIKFVKEVYNLSVPQGLGFLHFEEGGLTDKEVEAILERGEKDKRIRLSMDYVKGRACKMTVFKDGDRLFFRAPWYDHTDRQLEELLVKTLGKTLPELEKHNPCCNCRECRKERGEEVY